jgi:23S rRNA (cytidine1920-2'-O)/16S rRNA (cytidine1409-2'-O)-methyltransferase
VRLDELLVARGLLSSVDQARRAVMAGEVRVAGQVVDKPGAGVREDAAVELATRPPFVARSGAKLAAALDAFEIDVAGRVCLDVGASTGGFTDCLLQRGASRVYALDVGRGQLDWRLRNDPRVVLMEGINARLLGADALPEPCDVVTVDVSFISLLPVVPALLPHLGADGILVVLIKPQFEIERGGVGKGGIVRDEARRRGVIEERLAQLTNLGLALRGAMDSPLAGAEGNVEALAAFGRRGP